jgi:transaldolase
MTDKVADFSLWLDFVERDFLAERFGNLLEDGIVNGATSNPAIFSAAISSSPAYKEQLDCLAESCPKEKYEVLAIADIRQAARALLPLYRAGNDGLISLEVDPFLSHDTEGTIAEARRLHEAIGEPNVMIKIPATQAGYAAMRQLAGEGKHINATLVFSPAQARECAEALKAGIESAQAQGKKIEAVISVFVSRFDRLLDPVLVSKEIPPAHTGIYNAAAIYSMIEAYDLPNLRTLFASTGVKGEALAAEYYIRELLAPHSINTAPLATIQAYMLNPATQPKLPIDRATIDGHMARLTAEGIHMDAIYDQLIDEGLQAFRQAFEGMLKAIS